MNRWSKLIHLEIVHAGIGIFMAILWGCFAYRHVIAFQETGDSTYLILCVSETLSATFFMFRSAPKTVSVDPLDWFFAIAGTFTGLLLCPAAWGLLPPARHFITFGTVLQIFGLISLNRSYALVAAKREVKTSGMYRFVRHPLYASYLLTFTGYVLANTTLMNFIVYAIMMGLLYVRLIREERHLILDPIYAEYMRQVRFRVIPMVF